jgi:DNA segregation ATPase FtsK/SpoIIIE-like protein
VWVLLGHHGVEFLRHPQMWLIPFAINVLLAGHLNRNRLGRSQRAALNYAGLSLLYLSSAADLFIAGLGDSTVLPLALAALSMVGIVLGIVLRVRAFLFQGMTFLAFVVVTMIVHAVWAREQQWLMWVSGIGLGAAAFTVFAVFRKYRDEVLQLYEEVRSWS